MFDPEDIRICSACNSEVKREDMLFTHDCQGITMRLVCFNCYDKIMNSDKGYDGQYYDSSDENLDENW